MRLLLHLFILFPLTKLEFEASMVKIHGKVTSEVPSSRGTIIDKDLCVTNCENDIECILVYMDANGYCLNYKYSEIVADMEVVKGDGADGLVVVFKTNQITCPKVFTTMDFAYIDRRINVSRPIQWTTTGTGWTLPKAECADPWVIFRRTETLLVCLQLFPIDDKNQTEASTFCESQGYKMTGIGTNAEFDYLVKKAGDEVDFWIDGVTSCSEDCYAKDITFTDGYTEKMIFAVTEGVQSNAYCMFMRSGSPTFMKCSNRKPLAVACGFAIRDANTF